MISGEITSRNSGRKFPYSIISVCARKFYELVNTTFNNSKSQVLSDKDKIQLANATLDRV